MNVCSTIAYAKQLNEVMQVTLKQQLVKIRAAALRDMDGEVQRLALVIPTIVTDHAQAGGSPTNCINFACQELPFALYILQANRLI
jgi:hypothetical protein